MLWNKHWDRKPKHPSFEGFIAFIKTQDPAEEYDWDSWVDCPAARYFRSIGFESVRFAQIFPTHGVYHLVLMSTPWTYEAVLERAAQYLANQRKSECSRQSAA